VKIKNDAEIKFKVNLDSKDAESGMSKLGEVGKNAFKVTTAAIGTATVALGGLVMKSVEAAGELEQQIGGTEAVFKEFSKTVQEQSEEAYAKSGLSANKYMATMNKMGALMQGSGISIEKSMDLSSQAMQRAADIASIMGIDIDSAMESIAGAAKGNFTMMDNLGVAMNATTIEAYALSKGIKTSYAEMENAQKIGLAMEMFLEKTAYAEGNYAKENETFAGSLQTLKASFENFMSGAGEIDAVIKSLEQFGKILMESIVKMAPQIVDGIIQLINAVIPQIPTLIKTLLPTVIDGLLQLITGILDALPDILTMLATMLPQVFESLANGLLQGMNQLSEMMPTLIPIIVDGILSLLEVFNQNIDQFLIMGGKLILGLIQGLINSIPQILANLPTILMAIINFFTVSKLLSAGMTLLKGLGNGLVQGIPNLIKNIPKIIGGIINYFKTNGLSAFKTMGIDLIKGLWTGIKSVKSWILDKIKGFGKSILSGIKDFFGIRSPSKEFAWIGKMNIIGLEEGMEDNIPGLNSTIEKSIDLDYDTAGLDFLKNGAVSISSSFGNQVPNTYIEQAPICVTVNADMDVNKFGKAFVREVKTFSGGAKNSYNYGGGK